jgi:hypothetical protein
MRSLDPAQRRVVWRCIRLRRWSAELCFSSLAAVGHRLQGVLAKPVLCRVYILFSTLRFTVQGIAGRIAYAVARYPCLGVIAIPYGKDGTCQPLTALYQGNAFTHRAVIYPVFVWVSLIGGRERENGNSLLSVSVSVSVSISVLV